MGRIKFEGATGFFCVIYLRYNESLRRSILKMDFLDDTIEMTEAARFRNHYRFF